MEEKKLPGYYYACIEWKNGAVVKIPYANRDEARQYISEHFDREWHSKCWTE